MRPADQGTPHASESLADGQYGFPAPERAPLPRPERLNRNALTIAAVTMGVLVIAAVILVPPSRPRAPTEGPVQRPSPDAVHPTFLDQPIRQGVSPGARPTQAGDSSGSSLGPTSPQGALPRSQTAYGGTVFNDAPRTQDVGLTPTETPNPRVLSYRAALEAPVVASAREATSMRPPNVDLADFEVSAEAALPSQPPGQREATNAPPAPASVPSLPVRQDAGVGKGRHDQFLRDAASTGPTVLHTSVDPAPGPYALHAGTVIPATLVTEINSDLPGEILAQVSRDVYDSRTQRTLLVPRGSKLIGKYDNQIAVAQNRLLVAWTRVILPDGRSVTLPGLQTKDRAGAGGVRDQVDQHQRQVFGTAALLSMIGAGVQLSQPNGGYGPWGATPSTGQIAAGAAGQQLAEVASQMLRRQMDVQPTIRIRQGMPFNVFLNADLTFPAAYSSVEVTAAPAAVP
jgi:type IV secretory pathway VirB10-like protein